MYWSDKDTELHAEDIFFTIGLYHHRSTLKINIKTFSYLIFQLT